MTIDEAIETVKHDLAFNNGNITFMRALGVLVGFAEYHKEAEKNEPLTMEELMEMNGQPVWLDDSPNGWECFIVNLEYPVENRRIWSAQCGVDLRGRATSLQLLSECGLYRRPQKEAHDGADT